MVLTSLDNLPNPHRVYNVIHLKFKLKYVDLVEQVPILSDAVRTLGPKPNGKSQISMISLNVFVMRFSLVALHLPF